MQKKQRPLIHIPGLKKYQERRQGKATDLETTGREEEWAIHGGKAIPNLLRREKREKNNGKKRAGGRASTRFYM